ncbi:MAG TPA: hypothetical protein DEH78_02800, partial [Solibacterales bacterium]|nr:hypothetical protein [Bryobacterales bacterium]
REEQNNFLLDGLDNNDPYVHRFVVQPPVDVIQEFKVAINSFSAEYGRSAGGQVNVVTRRGTNDLHGFAYEYLRNRLTDARNFFDAAGRPKFIRNQMGLGAGGPVIREKLYFFANFDVLRERRGQTRLATVPSALERAGNFTQSGKVAVDPFTRAPFPGNVLPSARISPVGARVAALFPLPIGSGTAGNFLGQPVLREGQTQGSARADYQPTVRHEISLRYSVGDLDLFEPFAEDTDAVPGFGDFVRDRSHQASLHHQWVLSPRATNSLRAGYSRLARTILPENHGVDAGAALGVNWLTANQRDSGFPSFAVAGYSRAGDVTSLPIARATNTVHLGEGIAVVLGTHIIKAGFEARHARLASRLDLLTRGSLSFSGALGGAGMADLLLGFPSFGLQSVSDNPQTLRTTAYNAYWQDDWRLTPRLTLNLGVRYEYNTPPIDPTDRMTALDLNTGRLAPAGSPGVQRSVIQPDRNNFAPRAGLAWNASNHLTLRAGYGVYFDSTMLQVNSAQYFNPPQFSLRVFFPTATSLVTLANPFPLTGGIVPPPSLNSLDPGMVSAYLQHWNFGLQTSLPHLGALSLTYAGSAGAHLVRARDLNQPPPASGDVQFRRPNRAYGSIFFVESAANSNYHSLQAAFDRPLTRNLSIWSVYTFAKSIDDASAFMGTRGDKNFPQDSTNYRAERGLSSFDVTHRFVLAPIYAIPKGLRWIGGTELRGITVAQGGQPMTPILRFDNSNTGNTGGTFGSDRPDLAADPRLAAPGPAQWFDTQAFRIAPRYRFGTAGRNILRGPGLFSVDASVVRRFLLWGESSLSAELQAFNLLNRANFNLPQLFADDPVNFGRVFSAKAPRQLQFVLRLSF